MFRILCENCYNLLNLSAKLGFVQNRYPVYYKLHRSLVFTSQENASSAVQHYVLLQQSYSTSVQAALLPRKWAKKKNVQKKGVPADAVEGKISENQQTPRDAMFQAETILDSLTEGDVNTYLPEVALTCSSDARMAGIETIENTAERGAEDTMIGAENLPALSVQHKMKKKAKKSHSVGPTPEEAERMANTFKKESFLKNLKAYVGVCLGLNWHERAHSTVMFYFEKGNQSTAYHKVDSVTVFNPLFRYHAQKGDVSYIKRTVKLLRSKNIALDWQSYLFWLESISRKSISNDLHWKSELNEALTEMNKQGFSLEDLFLKTTPSKEQKELISKILETTDPSICFKPFVYPDGYTSKLLKDFDSMTTTLPGTKSLLGMSPKELEQFFFLQLSQERELMVSVKSIQSSFHSEKAKLLTKRLKEQEALWRKAVTQSLQSRLQLLKEVSMKKKTMNIYPYFNLFPLETYVELIMIEIRLLSQSSEYFSCGTTYLSKLMGIKIMTLHKIHLKHGQVDSMKNVYRIFLKNVLDSNLPVNPRQCWQQILLSNNLEHFQVSEIDSWPYGILCDIGKFLYDIIINDVTIVSNILDCKKKQKIVSVPAFFSVNSQLKNKIIQQLQPHRRLSKLYTESQQEDILFDVTSMPMLCPPLPWTNFRCGGFLLAQTPFVRTQESSMQSMVLQFETPTQQLYPVLDSLNNISMCPWIINKPILDLIIDVFRKGGNLNLSVPLHPSSLPLPPFHKQDHSPEMKKKIYKEIAVYKQEKNELYSLWCDALYKLSIANHFRDRTFWFPHNLDFRGRTYATPPHFNHLGSDLVRGILLFASGKPLGKNGLDWLKIHLVNLTGLKKKESNATRLAYANEIMTDILDSADQPFNGRGWWQQSEDPWQTLACCMELAKAMRSGNPETYVCHLPVHQDGTCNGLQHYAALGRDLEGAQQVNLSPSEKPQDVYSGVVILVEQERVKDANNGLPIAQILEGHINRKLIKQTVMTVVYGVTRYGARLQILKRLKEDTSFPAEHQREASIYLVKKTFLSIGEMFQNTSVIQYWLADCAAQISRIKGKPVEWVTPLGLPVVQPYLKTIGKNHLRSFVEMIGIPNTKKQVNAFPPNFIHSLDSTHMMLTSLYCKRNGIDFVSVHDCYWTHPCSVDAMNKICREQFVALHNQPILQDLSTFLYRKFSIPESEIEKNAGKKRGIEQKMLNKTLQQVPKKGSFHLEDVLNSTYFFN